MVRVRLFAALREAADASEVEAPGRRSATWWTRSPTVGDRFAAVAAVSVRRER